MLQRLLLHLLHDFLVYFAFQLLAVSQMQSVQVLYSIIISQMRFSLALPMASTHFQTLYCSCV